MILRILVLFSSPFSSSQIPLCRPNRYPTINAMTHGPFVTIKWSSHFVGRQWHQMTGVLIAAMMMPNALRVSSVTLRKPPCSKISGIPGKFPWAALEAQENCPGIPEIFEQGGLRKITDDTLKALGILDPWHSHASTGLNWGSLYS